MKFIFVLLFVAALASGSDALNPKSKVYNLKKEFLKADRTLKDLKKTEKELRLQLEKIKRYEAEAKAAKNFYEAQARKHGVKIVKIVDKNSTLAFWKKIKNVPTKPVLPVPTVVVPAAGLVPVQEVSNVQTSFIVNSIIAAPFAPVQEIAPVPLLVVPEAASIPLPVDPTIAFQETAVAPQGNVPELAVEETPSAPPAVVPELPSVPLHLVPELNVLETSSAPPAVVPELNVQEISPVPLAVVPELSSVLLPPAVVLEVAVLETSSASPAVVPELIVKESVPQEAVVLETPAPIDAPIDAPIAIIQEAAPIAIIQEAAPVEPIVV